MFDVNKCASKVAGRRFTSAVLTLTVASLGIVFSAAPARPSDTPKDRDKEAEHEMIQQLLVQIEELKSRVHDLEERQLVPAPLPNFVSSVAAAPASSSALPPAPASTPPTPAHTADVPQSGGGPLGGVQLRLFGDLGYHATDLQGDTNTFYIGSLDMFMTGTLTDRVSVLGEVLFTSSTDNSVKPDVERLLLQYKQNDHLRFGIGRYHTSIGYYNPTFHRGAWFQTAIGRPFMYAFDDDGGAFPLQEVGITFDGRLPSGKLGLEYTAEVGNGRNHLFVSDPAQNRQDVNNGKSVNFALSSHPSWVSGLDVGFSIYHDYLTFDDNINHSEIISTVHVVYTNSTYEFLNEAALTRHVGTSTGAPGIFHTPGFYTQFSRKFGKYRPYFRYQYINAGVAEPVFGDPTDGPVIGRRNGPSFGVRFDFNDHAAWKLQYDHFTRRGSDTISDRTIRTYNGLATEFSFAF